MILVAAVAAADRIANAQRPAALPLERGLVLSWVSSLKGEPDYESRMEITGTSNAAVTLRNSWNRGSRQGAVQWHTANRGLAHDVRRSTHSLYSSIIDTDPNDYSRSALDMGSAVMLDELKRQGWTKVEFFVPELYRTAYKGTLSRVGSESFPVVFNGQRTTVRGVRAIGLLENYDAQMTAIKMNFLFLDDSAAPLFLEAELIRPDGFRGARQLARISYRPDVENELANRCRVSVYDIYFATASAELDPASAPTLSAIAKAMTDHPDWHLTIVGHTDSIGTAESNADLSRRRAERARVALTVDYHVVTGRLRADGHGETQPIEDNGTVAGRARNRRVELVRDCQAR
jgi:outer membrane protein OmpA-like peptidoglycan-associated protein